MHLSDSSVFHQSVRFWKRAHLTKKILNFMGEQEIDFLFSVLEILLLRARVLLARISHRLARGCDCMHKSLKKMAYILQTSGSPAVTLSQTHHTTPWEGCRGACSIGATIAPDKEEAAGGGEELKSSTSGGSGRSRLRMSDRVRR